MPQCQETVLQLQSQNKWLPIFCLFWSLTQLIQYSRFLDVCAFTFHYISSLYWKCNLRLKYCLFSDKLSDNQTEPSLWAVIQWFSDSELTRLHVSCWCWLSLFHGLVTSLKGHRFHQSNHFLDTIWKDQQKPVKYWCADTYRFNNLFVFLRISCT